MGGSPLLSPERSPQDNGSSREDGLRPRRLQDYIGQRELKQVLGIAVQAPRPKAVFAGTAVVLGRTLGGEQRGSARR